MKAVIIGTGGVGSVGALALQSGGKCEVTVVLRSTYESVSKNGFEFDSVDYGHVKGWFPDHIAKSIEDAEQYGPFDYVVVSTKNIPEVQKTQDLVAPLVKKGTTIVLVQNGIGGEEPVMEAFPDSFVVGGISMIGSANYGGVIHHKIPDELYIGTYDKRPEAQAAMEKFRDAYDASKSKCEIIPNLKYRRWCKLIYNSSLNTTAALTGIDVMRLKLADLHRTVVYPAMYEVRAIAEADLGEKLPEGIEEFMIDSDSGVYYEPSMLVDVKKSQPMEIEVILGNPLRFAEKNNVPAPTLTMLYKLLHGVQFGLLEKKGLVKAPAPGLGPEAYKVITPINVD